MGGYDPRRIDWPFRYWELRVQGTGARSSYDAVFLLVVCARRETATFTFVSENNDSRRENTSWKEGDPAFFV